jgi:hypothetical protein
MRGNRNFLFSCFPLFRLSSPNAPHNRLEAVKHSYKSNPGAETLRRFYLMPVYESLEFKSLETAEATG